VSIDGALSMPDFSSGLGSVVSEVLSVPVTGGSSKGGFDGSFAFSFLLASSGVKIVV
jgi:hypothetical protein